MKLDDSIDKYMAKLIIKDYRQKEGLDYFDIYSSGENKFHQDGNRIIAQSKGTPNRCENGIPKWRP